MKTFSVPLVWSFSSTVLAKPNSTSLLNYNTSCYYPLAPLQFSCYFNVLSSFLPLLFLCYLLRLVYINSHKFTYMWLIISLHSHQLGFAPFLLSPSFYFWEKPLRLTVSQTRISLLLPIFPRFKVYSFHPLISVYLDCGELSDGLWDLILYHFSCPLYGMICLPVRKTDFTLQVYKSERSSSLMKKTVDEK